MTTDPASYQQATLNTSQDLKTIASTIRLQQLSRLSLPEIESLSEEIARVVPAGNVPGLILGGLARLEGREISVEEKHKHLGMMFRGVRQVLDKAVYTAFFAGPAAILYGYQQILRLAGKDPEAAFPEGTWQFYLEFALREDGARHANETTGFHTQLAAHGMKLSDADQLTAWVLACAYFLKQLPDALANEWYERVALKTLRDIVTESALPVPLGDVSGEWERLRPYQRGADAGTENYPAYRLRKFDQFLGRYLFTLPRQLQDIYQQRLKALQAEHLPAFQRQMSWLAYLEPDPYSETRVYYPLETAAIGVIWQGHYYLIPLGYISNPAAARQVVHAALSARSAHPTATLDDVLMAARRSEQGALRSMLDKNTQRELDQLRRTPILLNWDAGDARNPLAQIRQGKRGIGDHPLTIFRTSESIILDQSHIFFDGQWGAAVAEMLTGEALSWAAYLSQLPAAVPATSPPYSPALQSFPALAQKAREAPAAQETGAENTGIQLKAVMSLRKLLKQRSDLARVTVNDLLLLYRSLHAVRYQPSVRLQQALTLLTRDTRSESQQVYQLIISSLEAMRGKNPAMLIPLDASRCDPRERVFPMTFRNPLTDFQEQHQQALDALQRYRAGSHGGRSPEFQAFHESQIRYLRLISAFGEILSRYREVALSGQSTSTAAIRFLGHLPPSLQKLLDHIPTQFEVLNEIIKGEEVFSNMGRVAKGSSLRRFITAKDDNEQKTLAWGIITDDNGILHISLRDFRPHVAALQGLGMGSLAQLIAQDYLDRYVEGFNQYVTELREITMASRETGNKAQGEL